jgi:gas vesicle protein
MQNLLIPQESSKAVLDLYCSNLLSAHQVATGCADTLILQPPFTNSLLVTLPEDQALAAQHASSFKSAGGFGFANACFSGMISISATIIAFLNGLVDTAVDLDNEVPASPEFNQSLNNFRSIIVGMINTCTDINPDSGSILYELTQLNVTLVNLSNEIQDDNTRLSTAIAEVKNNAVITTLEAQQRVLQTQFADVNDEIAKGATTTIASDIAFGFSFAKEFLDGVSTGAVAGAVLDVVGEADAIKEFNKQVQELKDKQADLGDQISALATTIAIDKTESMTLTLTAAQIGEFYNRVSVIVSIATSLVSQMASWKSQLLLLCDYTNPPEDNYYAKQVSAGLNYWIDLNESLVRYSAIMAYAVAPGQ